MKTANPIPVMQFSIRPNRKLTGFTKQNYYPALMVERSGDALNVITRDDDGKLTWFSSLEFKVVAP